jgi:threonine dehydratase
VIVGWRCAVCGTTVDVAAVHPFTCPRATTADRHHVLHPLVVGPEPAPSEDPNPFVAYGPRLAWWAFARTHGMTEAACVALTRSLAEGFTVTPFAQSTLLSSAFGANVWVKDETGNIAGSHKGRHLVTILLHLVAAESLRLVDRVRRPLAIASCGNAALAAATLAQRAEWPLNVFVPTWASPDVLGELESLDAIVHPCERRTGEPGDPAVLRFREAIAAGNVPFSVQGPENALCLDGGRTIGWEMASAGVALDRVVVQVGGGALAACTGWGLGPDGGLRVDVVQSAGCAPLARAVARAAELGLAPEQVPGRWAQLMKPWAAPHSEAEGILDDETYDWLGVLSVMRASGGRALVAPESAIARAHSLGAATGIPVSATGTAGLAGLLTPGGEPDPGERVAVIFSGVERPPPSEC